MVPPVCRSPTVPASSCLCSSRRAVCGNKSFFFKHDAAAVQRTVVVYVTVRHPTMNRTGDNTRAVNNVNIKRYVNDKLLLAGGGFCAVGGAGEGGPVRMKQVVVSWHNFSAGCGRTHRWRAGLSRVHKAGIGDFFFFFFFSGCSYIPRAGEGNAPTNVIVRHRRESTPSVYLDPKSATKAHITAVCLERARDTQATRDEFEFAAQIRHQLPRLCENPVMQLNLNQSQHNTPKQLSEH